MSIDPNLPKNEGEYDIKIEKKTVEYYVKKDPTLLQGTSLITSSKKALRDENNKMHAAVYKGKRDIRILEVPRPLITDLTDAIVRITATSICGSDLHLYNGEIPSSFVEGYTFGHEAVGIVDEVGVGVKKFKKGDRVVISSVVACGQCEYCLNGEMSCCDVTNKSATQKEMFGHNTSALFGYSELFGGLDGTQAEYVRVPVADINLFRIPEGLDDKRALLVSDIACTGFHGCELADVREGDTVVIFGCGPVGLMTAMFAKFRKARIVISIDIDSFRLQFAKTHFSVETINSSQVDPIQAVLKILPLGPDKVIDCVGFRFPKSFLHKIQRTLGFETDSPNILNSAIQMCRKNGKIALIGDYFGVMNGFLIGAFMNKHLAMRGGQLWPHKYKDIIFQALLNNEINPSVVFTHTIDLSKVPTAYYQLDKHDENLLKILIIPSNKS